MNRLLFNSVFRIAGLTALGFLFLVSTPQRCEAQQDAVRIAAVINEDVITLFDVQSRIQLFLITSGLKDTIEIRQRLLPQVMNALIEEKLKIQEARREEIETTEAEVLSAVQIIEQNNGMPPGAFFNMLAEQGIDSGTFYSQVEADVVWLRVVREILARDVTVSEDEVNAVIDRLRANQGKPEYLLGEIFLPIGLGSRESRMSLALRNSSENAPEKAHLFQHWPSSSLKVRRRLSAVIWDGSKALNLNPNSNGQSFV